MMQVLKADPCCRLKESDKPWRKFRTLELVLEHDRDGHNGGIGQYGGPTGGHGCKYTTVGGYDIPQFKTEVAQTSSLTCIGGEADHPKQQKKGRKRKKRKREGREA